MVFPCRWVLSTSAATLLLTYPCLGFDSNVCSAKSPANVCLAFSFSCTFFLLPAPRRRHPLVLFTQHYLRGLHRPLGLIAQIFHTPVPFWPNS